MRHAIEQKVNEIRRLNAMIRDEQDKPEVPDSTAALLATIQIFLERDIAEYLLVGEHVKDIISDELLIEAI